MLLLILIGWGWKYIIMMGFDNLVFKHMGDDGVLNDISLDEIQRFWDIYGFLVQ